MAIQRLILKAGLLLILISCTNPFSTRTPAPPDMTPGQPDYDTNNEAEFVISNFILSYEDKNLSHNMDLFSKSEGMGYRFNPDPQLINQYSGPWTITDESEYFNKLISSERKDYPIIQLLFSAPVIFTGIQPSPVDSVVTNVLPYLLQIDYGDSVATYNGNCFFKLFKDPDPPNYWSIYYWQDNAQDGAYNKSWSYLKLFVHTY